MRSILDFATYLVEQIHYGLIRIAKGEMDKPFYWYSVLMYICLYKGSTGIRERYELDERIRGSENAYAAMECSCNF